MDETRIREEMPGDRGAIAVLLAARSLPVPHSDDVPVRFLVASAPDGSIVGSCGWEIHADEVLLRSVATAEAVSGRGIGARLVSETLRRLDEADHERITLVTLDADGFFRRFGFVVVERNDVPSPIRRSTEYRLHACAGGVWMTRRRGRGSGPL